MIAPQTQNPRRPMRRVSRCMASAGLAAGLCLAAPSAAAEPVGLPPQIVEWRADSVQAAAVVGIRPGWVVTVAFLDEHRASTLCLIEDLVHSLDTGEPPRGGAELARANTELIFAFVESHQRGGARVELPLAGSAYRLERDRAPRQPKYEPDA